MRVKSLLLLLVIIIIFSSSCKELLEPISDENGDTVENEWFSVDSLGAALHSAHFLNDHSGYAIGTETFYYDGYKWMYETSNSGKYIVIVSSTAVYTNKHFYNGIDWEPLPFSYGESVTAVDENNVWVGGSNGKIQHFNGISWILTEMDLSTITQIKALSPTLVYAVDSNGKIIKYDGNGWRILYDTGMTQSNSIYITGLDVIDDGSFWITAYQSSSPRGIAYKFTNDRLEKTLTTENVIRCVHTESMQKVWFGGDYGSIWEYSSGSLKKQYVKTTQTIYDIAASQTKVFAVGAKGVIFSKK